MNDLDVMEEFRAEMPPADPEVLARARAAMFRQAQAGNRRRARWPVPVAAMAALVAAGVAVVALQERAGPSPSPEAVRVLRLAAAEARRDPALAARPDQFVYVRSRVAYAGASFENGAARYIPPVEKDRRVWLSVDGSRTGLLRERAVGEVSGDTPLDAGFPAYQRDLPTETVPMRNWLYAGTGNTKKGGNPPDVTAFMKVGDTLHEQYVPPAAAAALYEAAATIPGTAVVEQVDLAGRRGIAVSKTHHATRHDLIFDATSFRFLGEREVAQRDAAPFPDGAVIGWSAQLRVAIVDRAGQDG
ncbi:CU044_5270 family protein [Actinoplanes sp. URMC 104]|uniref:CU044_5270 family protein n=1 Tax=Actinoplanes sp. URMC 104 TaxID=3423409 RepID=UPI003F1CE8CA